MTDSRKSRKVLSRVRRTGSTAVVGFSLISLLVIAVDGSVKPEKASATTYQTITRDAAVSANLGAGATGGEVRAIVMQTDGKILIGGSFTAWDGNSTGGVIRLNADLTMDSSFRTNIGSGASGGTVQIRSIALRSDGKIVLAGDMSSWDGAASYGVVVLNSDGSLAYRVASHAASWSSSTYAVAVDSSNRAYVGGSFSYWNSVTYRGEKWARLSASDGSTDGDFSYKAGSHSNRLNSSPSKIEVSGNYVYVAGAFTDAGKVPENASSVVPVGGFARFDLNGVVDQSFNSGAGVGPQGQVNTFLFQPDGKIVIGGTFSTIKDASATVITGQQKLARVLSDGTVDTSFAPSTTGIRDVNALARDSQGRLLVACACGGGSTFTWNGLSIGRGLVRLTADGALDAIIPTNENSTSKTGAQSGTTINAPVKNVYAIQPLPSGKILVGGDFSYWSGTSVGGVTVLSISEPPPSVTAVSPTSGPVAGGTSLTVTGTGFSAGATVTVGGAACTSVAVVSATSITCTAPMGSAGAANIVVTNTDTQSGTGTGLYTYVAAPTVTAVSPTSGPAAGGTALTITGTGFSAGVSVSVGGTACSSVTLVSATSITCTAPAGSAGAVDVVVTNADTQTGTGAGLFTYIAPPAQSGTPNSSTSSASNQVATTTTEAATTTTTTTVAVVAAANTPTLVNATNQAALTRAPGAATALVNGVAVPVEVVSPADSAAGKTDPEERTPAQVQQLQQTAEQVVNLLDGVAGGDSGLEVVETKTGAELEGVFPDENVPVEDVVVVDIDESATLFAARDSKGEIVKVQPGAVLEVTPEGEVAVLAYGLPAGDSVELVIMSTPTLLGTYTVDASGSIETRANVPESIGEGDHTLVVASPNVKAALGLKVSESAPTAQRLPNAGSDPATTLIVLLLSIGCLMMLLGRRPEDLAAV